ncbi:MAG: UDP-3-O-acyl-N-acetylglucosamine deacetylase [Acetobacteraceae bacterium]|nr:UDP-3-O-acyl-N-acetylglucosamine deacetylase [Acetobacteraceae bacterium]
MDGLAENLSVLTAAIRQRTLKASIGCVGVGVHTGVRVSMALRPAPAGHGIVFRRTDLGADIPARFDHVVETRLCTVLGDPANGDLRVGTVEHVMAAIAGSGIDNLLIEIDGPEVPILDGSAASHLFLIDCAGIVEQDEPRSTLEILRRVRVQDGEAFAELRPAAFGFDMAVSIEFQAAIIGRQALSVRLTPESFRHELARARTFALVQEVSQMQAAGLARGGSLANALVVDGARVLNPGGLRMADEFVRHKLLDVVGDIALAGAPLRGRFVAHRSGHSLNNRLLRALFADPGAWRQSSSAESLSGHSGVQLPAAAAPA